MTVALPLENPPSSSGFDLIVDEGAPLADLWNQYWLNGSLEARNDLVVAFTELVERVVRRLPSTLHASWDSDDLRSFGLIGLIDAVEHFAPSSDVGRFAAYAMLRIRGAIFDELRRADWLPRSVRRRVSSHSQAAEELSANLGRMPAHREVCAELGLEEAAGEAVRNHAAQAQVLRLDHRQRDDSTSSEGSLVGQVAATPDCEPDFQLLEDERRAELRVALARLPERQRTVLALHLFGGRTQQEIGAMLGVSHSRVCQIESDAIAALRHLLGVEEAFGLAR